VTPLRPTPSLRAPRSATCPATSCQALRSRSSSSGTPRATPAIRASRSATSCSRRCRRPVTRGRAFRCRGCRWRPTRAPAGR
jgi:hypothetical protein